MRLPSLKLNKKLIVAMAAGTLVLAGCGDHDPKGFFDPGATGRWKSSPLVVPILDKLNIGVEQPDEQFAEATDVRPEDLVPSDQDYRISPNDLVAVTVGDLLGAGVQTPQQMRVSATGNISLPSIGEIHAAGKTETELEQAIVQAYRDAKLIQNAQVTVQVLEARGKVFSILGAVPRPGQYPIISNNFRILDALVLAGDAPLGSDMLYVIRPINNKKTTTQPSTQESGNAETNEPTESPFSALEPAQSQNSPTTSPAQNLEPANPTTPPDFTVPTPPANNQNNNEGNIPGGGVTTNSTSPVDSMDAGESVQMADGDTTPATQQTATAENQPTTQPALGEPEGHIVMLEGKPEQIGGVATSEPTTEQSTEEASAAPTTQPAGEPFEFNLPPGATQYREIRVPLGELKNGNMKYNIVIRPGDLIEIPGPMQGVYYVGGHVNRPGVYQIVGQRITLKQAVIAAGMFDQLAMPARTEIVRRIGGDKEVYAEVNLDRIFAGEDPDIYVKPNDVLNVGTTFLSPFIAAIRNGFRITYGFGFIYDKNFNTEAEIGRRP